MPPPAKVWNELLIPPEYPLAFFEMSFLLPHFIKEGRGRLAMYFTRVYNPVWTNPDGMSWIEMLSDESKVERHACLTPTWSETAWFADYVLPMGHASERHDLMSQRISHLLNSLLSGAAHTHCFSHRGHAHRQTSERSRRHAKNVSVKIVGVNYFDLRRLQPVRQTSQLFDCICVVEAGERKGRNFSEVKIFDRRAQASLRTETSEMDLIPAALFQQSGQLQRLALRTTLIKTIDQLQYSRLQTISTPLRSNGAKATRKSRL